MSELRARGSKGCLWLLFTTVSLIGLGFWVQLPSDEASPGQEGTLIATLMVRIGLLGYVLLR